MQKGIVAYVSIYTKCPEQANQQRQNLDKGFPGETEMTSDCWWVQGLSWREMRHVQCGGDICIWVVY